MVVLWLPLHNSSPTRPTPASPPGPRTEDGKRRSSQNARQHGLFLSDACLRLECPQEWADTLAEYLVEHCPATATERQLVHQLTLATLRQRRIERIETSLVNQHSPTATNLTREQASDALADAYTQLDRQWAALNRARAQAERSFYRALKELRAEAKAHPYRPRNLAQAVEIETATHHTQPARRDPIVQPASTVLQNEPNPAHSGQEKQQPAPGKTAESGNTPAPSALQPPTKRLGEPSWAGFKEERS